MKENSRLMFEVAELVLHSLNGILDDTGLRRLEELLAGNPAAFEYYQDVLLTHVGLSSMEGISFLQENNNVLLECDFWQEMLQEEKTAPEIIIPDEEPQREIQKIIYPAREKRKASKFSIFMLVTSAAAMLFIVLFSKFPSEEILYDAIVVDSFNAQWADPTKFPGVGGELNLSDGDHWLQSGYVKLLFGNGAEVVIESPVRFEILSANELNLISGRAYSKVPERARGFTISTPNSQVIDLGTEFGVEVIDDASSVHMIEGKASVLPSSGFRTQKPIELIAGRAKIIDRNGIAHDIRVDNEKFVADISSKMEMIYRADKTIEVGSWNRILSADPEKDLNTAGRLIRAVNIGPTSAKAATVCGMIFEPLSQRGTVIGGRKDNIAGKFKFYNGSDEDLNALLSTGAALGEKANTEVKITLDGLQVGKKYRVQLILNFAWYWCDVNCYGASKEYMYFPNTINNPELGLATYIWKAKTPIEQIELTSPNKTAGEWNLVHLLGYVLHEIDESEGSLRKH